MATPKVSKMSIDEESGLKVLDVNVFQEQDYPDSGKDCSDRYWHTVS